MPAFKDKPGAVNVDGSRNGYGDDFFDASENRSQLYTYEAFDFNVSIPITYAEFGHKADLLQENAKLSYESIEPFVVFGFSMSRYKKAKDSDLIDENLVMQNIDAMIDLFEAKLKMIQ